jgi:hypothetical protein
MKSYDNIWNPLTKKLVKTKSNIGKKILNNYIKCINSKKKDNKYSKILNIVSNKFIYSYKKTGKELINNYIKYLNIKYLGGSKVIFKRSNNNNNNNKSNTTRIINITKDGFLNYATKQTNSESEQVARKISSLMINCKINLNESIFNRYILIIINDIKENKNKNKRIDDDSITGSIFSTTRETIGTFIDGLKKRIINSIIIFLMNIIGYFTSSFTLLELVNKIHSANITTGLVKSASMIKSLP